MIPPHIWHALGRERRRVVYRGLRIALSACSIPWHLVKINFYLVVLYYFWLKPKFEKPLLEAALILGASMATLLITWTIGDILLSRLNRTNQ